jgi:hypothetical protein
MKCIAGWQLYKGRQSHWRERFAMLIGQLFADEKHNDVVIIKMPHSEISKTVDEWTKIIRNGKLRTVIKKNLENKCHS